MQFNRSASLEIRKLTHVPTIDSNILTYSESRLIIKDVRITFQVRKNLSSVTNQASISIWNLKDSTRAFLNAYGDQVILRAGYEEDGGERILFIGNSTLVSHKFNFPDVVTRIEINDGEMQLSQRIIRLSFSNEVQVIKCIQDACNLSGLNIANETKNILNALSTEVYQFGDSFHGQLADALTKYCQRLNLKWSIQNAELYVLSIHGNFTSPIIQINSNNGLIGVPERYTYKRELMYNQGYREGYRVRTLLNPRIIPTSTVGVFSQTVSLDQQFYVNGVTHSGDTYGETWESNLELVQLI